MEASCALAVMARYPMVGLVKTRLAAAIGAERACSLYRAFIADVDVRFGRGVRTLVWMYEPPTADFAALITSGARCLVQKGSCLGERMHRCFQQLCGEGFGAVVMIGADVPHVREEWLEEAEAHLDRADVVLGPSLDGGYYLIAMREPHDVFSGVTMSTAHVLADTCVKAKVAGLRVHLLPASFDVDDIGDVERLRALLADPDMRGRLPETAAWLDRERSVLGAP